MDKIKIFLNELLNWLILGLLGLTVFIAIIFISESFGANKKIASSKTTKTVNSTSKTFYITKTKLITKSTIKKVVVHDTLVTSVLTKCDFIYAEGDIIGKSFKVEDSFTYEARFPSELYEGYFTLIKTTDYVKFFVWTSEPLDPKIKKFKGWYVQVDEFGRYGVTKGKDEYVDVLFPITKRK